MAWPRRVDPNEVRSLWALAHSWFSPASGWGLTGEPEAGLAMTLAVLASRPEFWDLHSYATAYWSIELESEEHRPSFTIPALAIGRGPEGFVSYASENGFRSPGIPWVATARVLVTAVSDRSWFDSAAVYTIDEFDSRVEECRRRYPEREQFDNLLRCLRGQPPLPA
jgi:hypothetical protein